MAHFYNVNGNKTEDYVTLVSSDAISEVDIHNNDIGQDQRMRKGCAEKTRCAVNITVARFIEILVVLALSAAVATLSFRVYMQDNENEALRKSIASEKRLDLDEMNSTSVCNFSISDLHGHQGQESHQNSRKVGQQRGSECIRACLHMKKIDPWINGVTAFVDPTKEGCWCQRNMTSINNRYRSCFLESDNSTVAIDVDTTAYRCEYKRGDGFGGTTVMIGHLKGNECISACLHLKKFDDTVNGVTVFAATDKRGCWCEKGMQAVFPSIRFKTCRLVPRDIATERIDGNLCDLSIGYGSGGNKLSMGKRRGRECIDHCLHMKRIDPSINGVTVSSKERDCWCEQDMKNITGQYKTCYLTPSNDTCTENNISYHGNDIKKRENIASWERCSDLCRGLTKCRFWTWEASEQSCRLKSRNTGRTYDLGSVSGSHICGTPGCEFSLGEGVSGSRRQMGNQKGSLCVDACLYMKAYDPMINGVTVYSHPTKGRCYCERNMSSIDGKYKSCFLKPNISQPLTHFNETKPSCELKAGIGIGMTDVFLGKFKDNACINACLHLKKIDDTVNGITVSANSRCWCESGLRRSLASSHFKSCIFKYNKPKARTRQRRCKFSYGPGIGRDVTKLSMGRQSVSGCIDICLHMKRIDPSINGITLKMITDGCWCVRKMEGTGEYKTCFLKS